MTIPAADTWTTAYLAALADPDETPPFVPQPKAFTAQTIRQAVRLRRGGTAVRLVLSNEFGHAPLVIDQIGVSGSDASTILPALRDGAARWQVLPGQTAASDPVPLPIAAGQDLIVTCFVSSRTEPSAFLHSALRTGEAAPGNQLGRRELTGPQPFISLYWVSKVLVNSPAEGPVIVALGDSITAGVGTTLDRDQRYPDHLQRRLSAAGLTGAVVLNAGLGVNRLLRPRVGPSMTERFPRDVLAVAESTHVVIMGGGNDIVLPSMLGEERSAADDIVAGLFGLARRAARHGIQPVLGTLTPFGGSTFETIRADGNENIRQAVNHALTTQQDWPVADFAAALADPGDPTLLAAAFDSGDGVHPGDAGARALADTIDLVIFDPAILKGATR